MKLHTIAERHTVASLHPIATQILMRYFSFIGMTITAMSAVDNETFLVECGDYVYMGHINAFDTGYKVEIDYQLPWI